MPGYIVCLFLPAILEIRSKRRGVIDDGQLLEAIQVFVEDEDIDAFKRYLFSIGQRPLVAEVQGHGPRIFRGIKHIQQGCVGTVRVRKERRVEIRNGACDRHDPSAIAYTIIADDLSAKALTYGELREESEKLADALVRQGFKRGDRIATLMGKGRPYLVSILAIWRMGAVHVPLFTAFAPPAILLRLKASVTKLVICDGAQKRKLDFSAEDGFQPTWRILTTGTPGEGELSFDQLLSGGRSGFGSVAVGGASPFIQIYMPSKASKGPPARSTQVRLG